MEFWVFQIVKFWKCAIFEIKQFQKFDNFCKCIIKEIFGIFQVKNFWNFPNRKFLEFP